jgi:hypothetical protein
MNSSLCNLRVLCASVVNRNVRYTNHRDTEKTEVAQRREKFGLLGQSYKRHKNNYSSKTPELLFLCAFCAFLRPKLIVAKGANGIDARRT